MSSRQQTAPNHKKAQEQPQKGDGQGTDRGQTGEDQMMVTAIPCCTAAVSAFVVRTRFGSWEVGAHQSPPAAPVRGVAMIQAAAAAIKTQEMSAAVPPTAESRMSCLGGEQCLRQPHLHGPPASLPSPFSQVDQ